MIPSYCERVRSIPMGQKLGLAYQQLERSATEQLAQALAAGKTVPYAAWAQALLVYPEMPWLGWKGGNGRGVQVGEAPALPKQLVYPLDQALAEYAREQLWDGLPLIVFTENTGRFDEQDRLASMFEARSPLSNGAPPSIAILRATLSPEARSAWVEQQVQKGVHILICNPELSLDLNLTYFKRIAYKRIPTSRTTLYRSARCLLGPEQDTSVETVFFVYDGSLAKRLLWAMFARDGSFSITDEYSEEALDQEPAIRKIASGILQEMGFSSPNPV